MMYHYQFPVILIVSLLLSLSTTYCYQTPLLKSKIIRYSSSDITISLFSSLFSDDVLSDESKLTNLKTLIEKLNLELIEAKKKEQIWKVDNDSGDLECGSSSDKEIESKVERLTNEKRKAEKEASTIASILEDKKLKLIEESKKASPSPIPSDVSSVKVEIPGTTSAVAEKSGNTLFNSLTASTNTGFDVGLLIAFPLMVGSLLFFLFFPIIGEQLSGAEKLAVPY